MRLRECELVYRVRTVDAQPAVKRIVDSGCIARLMGFARERATESLWAILLDARNRVIAVHECARGGVSACPLVAADVFRAAVVAGANAIILVHNHPSGSPEASADDLELTKRLVQASRIMGIRILDHVIVASEGHTSMLDAGCVDFSGVT